MSIVKKSFLAGIRDASPILLGLAPFGFICGAYCVSTGMPHWAAINFSLMIYAGASQLVANQLMAEGASTVVVIMTGLIINLRLFMYSASLAPHVKDVHPVRKGILAYFLADQAYAVSIARFNQPDADTISKPMYFMGTALFLWTCFFSSSVCGVYLGALIPPEWDLGFAIPLTFTAVAIPAIKDRPAGIAAVSAAVVAVGANQLPYNLGLIVGAVTGIVVGYLAERRMHRG
ncbi:AzlC family ABC transporter permease [Pseudodesulfovibrio sediminis]|uniref:Branched-chain amino acid transporter AzlC n=1 Tax=Pseudodesulfovibrio sediminis TaxID=2810563 RepID=A0ABN6EXE3_9BACT|nr:AzlC family ABC transporter permease [Pseudodesulfovibrio sediminis]BCS89696.1 branched-chain amino acid transporter AzlC [Pseudodesulfovibrio sediminis]